MYLLYLDASGTPEIKDPNCSTYVLSGLCVHESVWPHLEQQVALLRNRYSLHNCSFELHAKDICAQLREQEKIPGFEELSWSDRRMAYEQAVEQAIQAAPPERRSEIKLKKRATIPIAHLSRKERSQLYEEVLDLVGNVKDLVIFSEAIDKRFLLSRLGRTDAVRDAFLQVVTRFDAFLRRQNRRGRPNKGMIIFDDERTYKDILHKEFTQYRQVGHAWGKLEHVIEQPFFVDSAAVNAVQLIDICAYAIRRHIERAELQNPHEINNFKRLHAKFDRDGKRLHGIRHFCSPGSCRCLVCQERGHGEQLLP